MSDAVTKLRLSKAEHLKAVSEIDRDLEKLAALEQIAAKYGLRVVAQSVEKSGPSEPTPEAIETAESITKRSQREAKAFIRAAGRPLPLSALFEHLTSQGLRYGGIKPKSVLSAYLAHDDELVSIKGRGWWLKGRSPPAEARKTQAPNGQLPLAN
jgi:hypothetical protein